MVSALSEIVLLVDNFFWQVLMAPITNGQSNWDNLPLQVETFKIPSKVNG